MKVTYLLDVRIPVSIEAGTKGIFYATSRLVPGLLATGSSEKEAISDAEEAFRRLAQAEASR